MARRDANRFAEGKRLLSIGKVKAAMLAFEDARDQGNSRATVELARLCSKIEPSGKRWEARDLYREAILDGNGTVIGELLDLLTEDHVDVFRFRDGLVEVLTVCEGDYGAAKQVLTEKVYTGDVRSFELLYELITAVESNYDGPDENEEYWASEIAGDKYRPDDILHDLEVDPLKFTTEWDALESLRAEFPELDARSARLLGVLLEQEGRNRVEAIKAYRRGSDLGDPSSFLLMIDLMRRAGEEEWEELLTESHPAMFSIEHAEAESRTREAVHNLAEHYRRQLQETLSRLAILAGIGIKAGAYQHALHGQIIADVIARHEPDKIFEKGVSEGEALSASILAHRCEQRSDFKSAIDNYIRAIEFGDWSLHVRVINLLRRERKNLRDGAR